MIDPNNNFFKLLNKNLLSFSTQPGCYLFKNRFGNIIYIGKAKNLKLRLKSYLNVKDNFRFISLTLEVVNIETIITNNEKEALLLEFNLIKTHHPKYNISLTDDRKLPYIEITNIDNKNYAYKYTLFFNKNNPSLYYGPFPDGSKALKVLELLQLLFPLKRCTGFNLTNPCFYFQINQCSGACFKEVPTSYYEGQLKLIDDFFKGKINLKIKLKHKITQLSKQLQFEEANKINLMINKIDLFLDKQIVQFNSNINDCFINYEIKQSKIAIVTLFFKFGRLISTYSKITFFNDNLGDLIFSYLNDLSQKTINLASIILPVEFKDVIFKDMFNIKIESNAQETSILKLGKLNAVEILNSASINKSDDVFHVTILTQLSEILNLDFLTNLITLDTSFMVHDKFGIGSVNTYYNGILQKKLNKTFVFKMEEQEVSDLYLLGELIKACHKKHLFNNINAIIVDGGKLQVNKINDILNKLNIQANIYVIGLVKDDKHNTDKIIFNNNVYIIDKSSELFFFLARMQDDVHNLAIRKYKSLRNANLIPIDIN